MFDVVKITDGLGNQIFQYAFARSLYKKYKRMVYLDARDVNNEMGGKNIKYESVKYGERRYVLDNFRIRLPKASENVVCRWNYAFSDRKIDNIVKLLNELEIWPWLYNDEEVGNVEIKENHSIYYKGYWFDLKYYADIREELKKEIRTKNKIILSKELLYLLSNENVVAVHIRRGDFLRIGRDISEKGYYQAAFAKMNELLGTSVYFVFSDDIEWVKSNIVIPGKAYYVSDMGYKDYEEFMIMRKCSHFIIANSTFSYWPAYLNDDGIVICPKRWKTEIIPKEWINI